MKHGQDRPLFSGQIVHNLNIEIVIGNEKFKHNWVSKIVQCNMVNIFRYEINKKLCNFSVLCTIIHMARQPGDV